MSARILYQKIRMNKGFTLVELLVSIGIFVIMTALLVARYGSFNDSTLLNNLAYDVALTIRTAQTYGMSVKRADATITGYKNAYGVDFDLSNNSQFMLFSDFNNGNGNDSVYKNNDTIINKYQIKAGSKITGICVTNNDTCTDFSNNNGSNKNQLDITFKRPDPNAVICSTNSGSNCQDNDKYSLAKIRLTSASGLNRIITVRSTGQISIED